MSVETPIESLQKLFSQAAIYNLNTAGRTGTVVNLDASNAREVLFTGDLHGHRGNFQKIFDLADLDNNPGRHVVIQELCHGGPTFVDGSCGSSWMVIEAARLICRYPGRVHYVLGNHELAEMTGCPIQKRGRFLNESFSLGLKFQYGNVYKVCHQLLTRWFWSCPIAIRWNGSLLFSHSIPHACDYPPPFDYSLFNRSLEDRDLSEQGAFYRLCWGRDFREYNAKVFAQNMNAALLLNGHDPCSGKGYKTPNSYQIIIDCSDDCPAYTHLTLDIPITQEAALNNTFYL